MSEVTANPPMWTPIPVPLPLEMIGQTIVGGWYNRGSWRVGICTYVGGDTNAFLSERSGLATHYLCAIPIAPPAPAERVQADALDRVDVVRGLVTDWDGDPAGPPVV